MKKSFEFYNDVGIMVKYKTLGIVKETDGTYVVYTDNMPSDNEFGIRLLAAKLIDEEKFELDKITRAKQKKIIDEFSLDLIRSGKKIKKS